MSQTQGKTMEYKRKTIDGYDSYEIDTLGNVYSNKNARNFKSTDGKLKQRLVSQGGYKQVSLYTTGTKKPKQLLVHRLVYQNFVGEIPDGMQIDHIDNDKHNNELDNLQVLSAAANMKKMWDVRGRSEIKEHVKDWLERGYPRKFISENLGVSLSYISMISLGKR